MTPSLNCESIHKVRFKLYFDFTTMLTLHMTSKQISNFIQTLFFNSATLLKINSYLSLTAKPLSKLILRVILKTLF